MRRILVINPNSNESVTDGLRKSLLRFADRAIIDCCTQSDGPFGIETDQHIASVIPQIIARIEASPDFDAYIIACYSDPGLAECRREFDKPVFGMQQSAVETAVSIGGQFGVLALSDRSIARHVSYIRQLGFTDRLAAELPLNISVDEAANDAGTFDKVMLAGNKLVSEFGASSIILGCAGMAAIKDAVESKMPVPVIEPAQAAVELAIRSN
jgi:Asp/Glu/hydantoin racemase